MDMRQEQKEINSEIVGLIPMAGQGTRISPLPCSKELYPIGYRTVNDTVGLRPKVAAEFLLEKMKLAGVVEVFVVLRKGKWDIPEYFGNGSNWGMHVAYLMMGLPYGPPYSMNEAYPFVRDKTVVFGFADILFNPDNAFIQLINRQKQTNADVLLGLIHASNPHQMDMVEVDAQGRIRSMVLKPLQTGLCYSWICAVWTATFTRFMHEFLVADLKRGQNQAANVSIDAKGDLPMGAVVQAAIQEGLHVEGVIFPEGDYSDIGTPEGLMSAVKKFLVQ